MVDPTRTRRRHHAAAISSRHERDYVRSEIRSGEASDSDDDEYRNSRGHSSRSQHSGRRTQRRRRRRKQQRRGKDPPFVVLLCQVGTVLLLLCLASVHVYRYVVPASLEGNYEYEYNPEDESNPGNDDDFRHEQELKLKELLKPEKETTPPPEKHPSRGEKPTSSATKQRPSKGKPETSSNATAEKPPKKTAPPLPSFNLSAASEWDAFGILERMTKHSTNHINKNNNTKTNEFFWREAETFRKQFAERYGGENAARMLLDRGVTTFSGSSSAYGNNHSNTTTEAKKITLHPSEIPSDVVATACRLHRAKSENRSVRMAFGGYSVTTGRGNQHRDSYPFRLQELLQPLLEAAGFAAPLSVTNAAIGGVPSFPYGWCLAEFWGGRSSTTVEQGADPGIPDVVSWDFGMNEGSGGPEGLEAYIRHLLATYSDPTGPSVPPKLIVKDHFAARHRREVLVEYASVLKDPILLHTDHAVEPIAKATKGSSGKGLGNPEDDWRRPPGFWNWREWGAPRGAPGQASHHPAVQEHRLDGWILAMHFVTALEYMVAMEDDHRLGPGKASWCSAVLSPSPESSSDPPFSLPPPVSRNIANDTSLPYDGIFFGYPVGAGNKTGTGKDEAAKQPWQMNTVRCRTTFEPKLSGDLSEIVVTGTMGEDLDPTLPKSQYYYNQGWTYDLSEAEKSAKRKLNLYPDGLGFRDSKEAYYGIYESPPMALLLPYEDDLPSSMFPRAGDTASDWYESIVLCQVNDKNTLDSAFSDPNTCNFGNDVGIRIGGVNATQNSTRMLNTIGSVYLGKPICKHVTIPPGARLTSHNLLLGEGTNAVENNRTIDSSRMLESDQTGLLVEVFVSNPHIVHVNQACSLSHVVWEQKSTRIHNDKMTQ